MNALGTLCERGITTVRWDQRNASCHRDFGGEGGTSSAEFFSYSFLVDFSYFGCLTLTWSVEGV